jgi:hypothetical protein
MIEPITDRYPDHVTFLQSLAEAENFARDPNLIAGRINLALHRTDLSPELKAAISVFSAKAILVLRSRPVQRPSLLVYHVFSLKALDRESDLDLARKWLQGFEKDGAKFHEEHLMPLALDIVARSKNFALTWFDRSQDAEPGEKASIQEKLTYEYASPWRKVEYVSVDVRVQTFNIFTGMPSFYNPYPNKDEHILFGEVNYQSDGMVWFANDNVLRLPRHDRGSPQKAQVLNWEKYYSLKPGEAAFFRGDREKGLAIYPSGPRDPEDPLPSVNMSLRRHIHQPG